MTFLPGSGVKSPGVALITEKRGTLRLLGIRRQAKLVVVERRSVLWPMAVRAGLGDVIVHPDFAGK